MLCNLLLLLLLGPSVNIFTEGCGRKPSPPPTKAPPTGGGGETTDKSSAVELICTMEEYNQTACLNGGACFAVMLAGTRVAACHCTVEYYGTRCQELNPEVFIPVQNGDVAQAGVVGSVAVGIIILVVFIAVAIIYRRYYRRKRQLARRAAEKKDGQELIQQNTNGTMPHDETDATHITDKSALNGANGDIAAV